MEKYTLYVNGKNIFLEGVSKERIEETYNNYIEQWFKDVKIVNIKDIKSSIKFI